jgi:CheY-like chemotaxis protein
MSSAKKILVIDDDEPIREYLRFVLQKAGHQVTLAENGNRGLTLFDRNGFDTVITDISMPEKDGIDTIIAMRQKCPTLRIVAMSGVASKDTLLQIADIYGADAVLAKPFEGEQILLQI